MNVPSWIPSAEELRACVNETKLPVYEAIREFVAERAPKVTMHGARAIESVSLEYLDGVHVTEWRDLRTLIEMHCGMDGALADRLKRMMATPLGTHPRLVASPAPEALKACPDIEYIIRLVIDYHEQWVAGGGTKWHIGFPKFCADKIKPHTEALLATRAASAAPSGEASVSLEKLPARYEYIGPYSWARNDKTKAEHVAGYCDAIDYFERNWVPRSKVAELLAGQPAPSGERAAALEERVAVLRAHRATHAAEHDAANGKLHGYCIVCGVPWPCAYAGEPPDGSNPLADRALSSSQRAERPGSDKEDATRLAWATRAAREKALADVVASCRERANSLDERSKQYGGQLGSLERERAGEARWLANRFESWASSAPPATEKTTRETTSAGDCWKCGGKGEYRGDEWHCTYCGLYLMRLNSPVPPPPDGGAQGVVEAARALLDRYSVKLTGYGGLVIGDPPSSDCYEEWEVLFNALKRYGSSPAPSGEPSAEVVEKVAREMYGAYRDFHGDFASDNWSNFTQTRRDGYRAMARYALSLRPAATHASGKDGGE